jgi:hypothetical protein
MKMWKRRRGPAAGQDERDIVDLRDSSRQMETLLKSRQGLHLALPVHPVEIVGIHMERFGGNRRHLPTLTTLLRLFELRVSHRWRESVVKALAISPIRRHPDTPQLQFDPEFDLPRR